MTETGGYAQYVHDADADASFCPEDAVLQDLAYPGPPRLAHGTGPSWSHLGGHRRPHRVTTGDAARSVEP